MDEEDEDQEPQCSCLIVLDMPQRMSQEHYKVQSCDAILFPLRLQVQGAAPDMVDKHPAPMIASDGLRLSAWIEALWSHTIRPQLMLNGIEGVKLSTVEEVSQRSLSEVIKSLYTAELETSEFKIEEHLVIADYLQIAVVLKPLIRFITTNLVESQALLVYRLGQRFPLLRSENGESLVALVSNELVSGLCFQNRKHSYSTSWQSNTDSWELLAEITTWSNQEQAVQMLKLMLPAAISASQILNIYLRWISQSSPEDVNDKITEEFLNMLRARLIQEEADILLQEVMTPRFKAKLDHMPTGKTLAKWLSKARNEPPAKGRKPEEWLIPLHLLEGPSKDTHSKVLNLPVLSVEESLPVALSNGASEPSLVYVEFYLKHDKRSGWGIHADIDTFLSSDSTVKRRRSKHFTLIFGCARGLNPGAEIDEDSTQVLEISGQKTDPHGPDLLNKTGRGLMEQWMRDKTLVHDIQIDNKTTQRSLLVFFKLYAQK